MSRWTGDSHVGAVLAASDAWRARCFLSDGSLFTEQSLWTADNLGDLKRRFLDQPIEGSDRNFFEKLKQQLDSAPASVIQLAAEVVWLVLLFPSATVTRPDTKRSQITEVWRWSGTSLRASAYLEDEALMGVGHPGTAYLTRRNEQFGFILEVVAAWKALPEMRRTALVTEDAPWRFVEWLDAFESSDRRPMRNAFLYFLFPDALERNLSNDHRRKIVAALKHRLPRDRRPSGHAPLAVLDRAIFELRQDFERELGTSHVDFYRPPLYAQWFDGIREDARSQLGAGLKKALSLYDLELRQCGSKKRRLEDCKPVDNRTGFWEDSADATNKPLRWIIHFTLSGDSLIASVPDLHGSRRIAFANTAQGTSGAVTARVIPSIQVGDEDYVFYETWEWMLLFCFFPALPVGSSGQLFDDFDAATGRLEYMGHAQPYIAASLITLNDDDDLLVLPEMPRPIRYAEATRALEALLHVAPTRHQDSGSATDESNLDGE